MKAVLLLALLGLSAVAVRGAAVCQTAKVEPNDSVTTIASKYGIQPSVLDTQLQSCSLTPGYKPGDFLQVGQRICLPGWVEACMFVSNAVEDGTQACMYYKVQGGDTMESVSSLFGLARMNVEAENPGVNPNALPVGSFIKLPDWGDSCPEPGDSTSCRVYIAQPSDSLAMIAQAFVVDLTELQALNGGGAQDTAALLQPGQRIPIPPYDPALCGEGVVVAKPSNCQAYVVAAGDILFDVAAQFETTADQIIAINPALAAGGPLQPGTQILLPPADPSTCVSPQLVAGTPKPPAPPAEIPAPVETPSPIPSPSPVAPVVVVPAPAEDEVDELGGAPAPAYPPEMPPEEAAASPSPAVEPPAPAPTKVDAEDAKSAGRLGATGSLLGLAAALLAGALLA